MKSKLSTILLLGASVLPNYAASQAQQGTQHIAGNWELQTSMYGRTPNAEPKSQDAPATSTLAITNERAGTLLFRRTVHFAKLGLQAVSCTETVDQQFTSNEVSGMTLLTISGGTAIADRGCGLYEGRTSPVAGSSGFVDLSGNTLFLVRPVSVSYGAELLVEVYRRRLTTSTPEGEHTAK